jgi:uncharacterized protein (TIGR02996 family)
VYRTTRAVGYDTGMSDEAALLAAIIADPDDDTPRVVYADWLQENGDPDRAEFIRLQCRRWRGDWAPDLVGREQRLLARNRMKWVGLSVVGRSPWEESWGFRRGFPECLWVHIPTLQRGHREFARVVWVRDVCVPDATPAEVTRLPRLEWGPHWERLTLRAAGLFRVFATPGMFQALAACPRADRLTHLTISGYRVAPDTARALAAPAAGLGGLRRLEMESCALEGETAALLRDLFGPRVRFTGRRENGEPITPEPGTRA